MSDPVIHYYPQARVFIAMGFRDVLNPTIEQVRMVESSDVSDLSINLTTSGSPSTFNLTINNAREQYFYMDSPQKEIQSLFKVGEKQRSKAALDAQISTSDIHGGNFYEFPDASSFFNFTYGAAVENSGISTEARHIIYYRRSNEAPYNVTEYWFFASDGALIELPVEVWQASSGDSFSFVANTSNGTKSFVIYRKSPLMLFDSHQGNLSKGRCVFQAMDRVVIFLSERFNSDGSINQSNKGNLIKCFSGLINHVNDSYNENSATISIEGEDITKWLKVSTANVNPALLQIDDFDQQPLQLFTERFVGLTGKQIIDVLCLGDQVLKSPNNDMRSELGDTNQILIQGVGSYTKDTTTSAPESFYKLTKIDKYQLITNQDIKLVIFNPTIVRTQDPSQYSLKEFEPWIKNWRSSWNFWQSEYQSRRDICYDVARRTNFQFYATGNGEIVYHQPRFNLGYILACAIPDIYIIDDLSIISWGFLESDDDIVTRLYVSTDEDFIDLSSVGHQLGWYQDDLLVQKYGMRIRSESDPMIQGQENQTGKGNLNCHFYAKSLMQRLVAERLQGQITITGRAELTPGFPIYVPFRNMIYNVNSVGHSFSYGQRFTTNIGLQYGRKPWDLLPELLSYQIDSISTLSDNVIQYTVNEIDAPDFDVKSGSKTSITSEVARISPDSSPSSNNETLIKRVIIHHTAGKSDPNITAIDIDKYHRDHQKDNYYGMGYDMLIRVDGTLDLSTRWTMGPNDSSGIVLNATIDQAFSYKKHRVAAGAVGYNKDSLHIALVGNFNNEKPTPSQLAKLRQIIMVIISVPYNNSWRLPPGNIEFHRDVANTDCPGLQFTRQLLFDSQLR